MIEDFLKNKTVGVIAPAGKINPQLLAQVTKIWQSWGAKVKIMPHVTGFEKDFFSAPAELSSVITVAERSVTFSESIVPPSLSIATISSL